MIKCRFVKLAIRETSTFRLIALVQIREKYPVLRFYMRLPAKRRALRHPPRPSRSSYSAGCSQQWQRGRGRQGVGPSGKFRLHHVFYQRMQALAEIVRGKAFDDAGRQAALPSTEQLDCPLNRVHALFSEQDLGVRSPSGP
jgi:hypothetical protein